MLNASSQKAAREALDRCRTCDFIVRFCRATLSRDIESCSTQLCMSHTATLSHKQEMTNQLGQCLFMRQSCSVRHVCMYVCMYESICNAPFLHPKQSRVRARRPNQKDVSLACYRKVSMSVLDHEVTTAKSSTVLEHKQQSCVVQNWQCGRLALADRHERQSVGGDDLYIYL